MSRKRNIVVTIAGIGLFSLLTPLAFDGEIYKGDEILPSDTARLENFQPSVISEGDLAGFQQHIKSYYYPYSCDKVWECYTHINPSEAWSGPINYLRLMKSGQGDYEVKPLKEGAVVLIELELFKNRPIYSLFQVSRVDKQNGEIEFHYGKQNVSQGMQRLKFVQNENGTTVTHYSYFQSRWKLRDKFLYPHFHEIAIDEFHTTVHNHMLLDIPLSDTLVLN